MSFFHEHFGYYAQGVGPETAHLPRGWPERLVRFQTVGTNGRIAYCLEPTDLLVSKACAAREKDRVFNRALLSSGVVGLDEGLRRADLLQDRAEAVRVARWIRRLAADISAG